MPLQGSLFEPFPVEYVPKAPELGLRPYQQKARESVAAVHARRRGALVVLPTGTGKSRLAGSVAWDVKLSGGKVLILCPTIVLCQQMYADMRGLGLTCDIEQASNFTRRPLPDVVVASVASMKGNRLHSFTRDAFSLVIADECHRSLSGTYTKIFEHFIHAKLLGLTATPDRADGVSLGNVFDEVAYEMTMLSAITDGWLVPLRFKSANTDFDPRAIRTVAGEVDPGSVARELVRAGVLHEAANVLADLSAGERTVAFLPTVAASKAFIAELAARGVSAAHIDGTTPDEQRNTTFNLFKGGEVRVLSNVGVLTEGWDAPHASVIALLNPTKSRARLTQMIGRGTRLCQGKASALVIDFCHGRLRKGRLASPADALAGRMLSDDEYAALANEGDLADAIKRAEITAEEIAEKQRKAEEAAARKAERTLRLRGEVKKKKFRYETEEHSAIEILGGEDAVLTDQYIDDKRRKNGLCSLKQAKLLKRYGLDPDVSRKQAGAWIGAIAANGWKRPLSI